MVSTLQSSDAASVPPACSALLQPGRNCWRVERAARFAMLVDAAPYFRAVRAAILAARHSIFILSWDIDSRMLLVPEGANDGFPEPLGDLLRAVVGRRPELRVYILNWDFAMLYALEREWLPVYKLGWPAQRRLAFHMDGRHPIGASHHQKVVVVDDALAFVGGLDLTRCRWDTPEHAPDAPLRCGIDGKPHPPFHDVQALVDGAAARALGELARTRWHRAIGREAVPACAVEYQHWPDSVVPDINDVDVAIARTEPAFGGRRGVHEIRQLHLDAIAAARRCLFFENQYFTSGLIAEGMAARLSEPQGPEVVVVSPQTQSGWLEEATMGVLRARLHRRLAAADRYGRYRLVWPYLPGLDEGCLNVHSKIFIMDAALLSIGSANLSSRSMALDTECNLVLEARGNAAEAARIAAAIAAMRNRLLAEHLGTTASEVQARLRRHGSLIGAIESFDRMDGKARSLRDLARVAPPERDAVTPEQALFDPGRPVDPDRLVAQFVPKDARKPIPRRILGLAALALLLALLVVAWRWTPMREWLNLQSLVALARRLEALPFTPLVVLAGYVAGGLVMVPVTLLIAVTGIVFGPLWGCGYALAGAMLSAAVSYGIGAWLGRDAVRRLLGQRINRLSRRIARRGILAMMVVRVLPVAPFTVVNVVAGASHIRFRDFLLGTLLGMAPGIVLTVAFAHNLAEAVRNPSAGTISVLALVAVLLVGVAFLLQKLFGARADAGAP